MTRTIHPRTFIVQKARLDISEAMLRLNRRARPHVRGGLLDPGQEMAQMAKLAVRVERHPENQDVDGDVA